MDGGYCRPDVGRKPLFLVIYVTVALGIVLSTLFVLSALYTAAPDDAGRWFSSRPSLSPPPSDDASLAPALQDKTTGVSQPTPPATVATELLPKPSTSPRDLWTREIWDAPPVGTGMPPIEKFRLTRKVVKRRAKDKVIIVTFGNYAFMDFVLTWVKHLTDLNISNLLVGAMDVRLLEALYWKGIPVFDMESNMKTNDVGWGSPAFHKMGREKVFLINNLLPVGYELLMCDTDMVWMKNPLPYLAQFPEADILTSTDQVAPTVTDDSLEVWNEAHGAYNIGIFHWRPTQASLKFAKEWKDLLLGDDKMWDQNGFNDLIRKNLGPTVGADGLVYAFDGNLKLGILPASLFCSGHTYFVQRLPQQLGMEPYAVHTTFQFGGTDGKRHRLREAMLFYDPPEYFNAPGGLLLFKQHIPKSLLLGGKHSIETHFSLVNYQIKQVRSALAVASLLNRTLVMPTLWCRLDRLWFGHPGVLPGTITRQPFICPMDHIFEVNTMLSDLSEVEFGPRIDFREYSFLDNSLLPKKVKESWLDVYICEENSANCHNSIPGAIKFHKNSSEETFMQVFSSYKDVKFIQFSTIDGVFRGFSNKDREERFRKRVKRYTGIWCCVENRTPGHIYYDIYWDEKPGWKPQPPEKREDDHPPL